MTNGSGLVSSRMPAVVLAAVELRAVGLHPIALEELSKLPPLPNLPTKLLPKHMLDGALSVRRFGVVPDRRGDRFFAITHLRFFSRLSGIQESKMKIPVEILHGRTADAIRQCVRADIYAAALVDAVPTQALPAIAEELKVEISRGKEVVARCFGVDVRRFHNQPGAEKKSHEGPVE